jgi:hypothetical protein
MLLSLVAAFGRQRCDLKTDLAVIAIDEFSADAHPQEMFSVQSATPPRRHSISLRRP